MAKILLVDDDEQFRRMLQRTLERAGHSVVPASNGQEALDLFESAAPDLVLTDLIMPEREGLETILALRKRWNFSRIIAMSGGGRGAAEDYLLAARQLGVGSTLAKPFATGDLLNALNTALSAP